MIRTFQTSRPVGEMSLTEMLGEAVGAASTAWFYEEAIDPEGGHVYIQAEFDSLFASTVVDALRDYIQTNYTRKEAGA